MMTLSAKLLKLSLGKQHHTTPKMIPCLAPMKIEKFLHLTKTRMHHALATLAHILRMIFQTKSKVMILKQPPHSPNSMDSKGEGFQQVIRRKRMPPPKRYPSPKLKSRLICPIAQRTGKHESSTKQTEPSVRKVSHIPLHK